MNTGRLLAVVVLATAATACGSTDRTPARVIREPGPARAAAVVKCARVASPHGSDSARGTARHPYRSARRLIRALRPGETGCLRAGRYRGNLKFGHGGRPGAALRLRSYPRERARIIGIVEILKGSDHVVISHVKIEGDGSQNTIQVYGDDVKIGASDITNRRRGGSCLILGGYGGAGNGQAERVVITRNVFHDCGSPANTYRDHGIYAQNVVDGEITENVFVNPAAYAIQFYPNAQRMRFAHNVIDLGRSIRGGVTFAGDDRYASNRNVVEQNVIAYAATYNISSYWDGSVGSGNRARRNCLWAGTQGNLGPQRGFKAVDNVAADPLFVNRARRDYRLRAKSECLQVVGYDTAARIAASR